MSGRAAIDVQSVFERSRVPVRVKIQPERKRLLALLQTGDPDRPPRAMCGVPGSMRAMSDACVRPRSFVVDLGGAIGAGGFDGVRCGRLGFAGRLLRAGNCLLGMMRRGRG